MYPLECLHVPAGVCIWEPLAWSAISYPALKLVGNMFNLGSTSTSFLDWWPHFHHLPSLQPPPTPLALPLPAPQFSKYFDMFLSFGLQCPFLVSWWLLEEEKQHRGIRLISQVGLTIPLHVTQADTVDYFTQYMYYLLKCNSQDW